MEGCSYHWLPLVAGIHCVPAVRSQYWSTLDHYCHKNAAEIGHVNMQLTLDPPYS